MNKITVYRHRRLDTFEIFYVGIGKTIKRAYTKTSRSNHWKSIVNKVGYQVEIIQTVNTWEDACELEMFLIKLYGRKDLQLGNLVNHTDGGDGNLNPSKETRDKISKGRLGFKHDDKFKELKRKQALGNKNRLGQKNSKLSRDLMSATSTSKKIVLDTSVGVYYDSAKEASFYYNINYQTLKKKLNGNATNNTNLIYC